MLRKYGAPEEVALAAEQHHDDVEATSVEALLSGLLMHERFPSWCSNISAENFVERMRDLENVV